MTLERNKDNGGGVEEGNRVKHDDDEAYPVMSIC